MIPLILCFFAPFAYDQYMLPRITLAAVLVAAVGAARGFNYKTLSFPLAAMLFAFGLSALLSGDLAVNFMGRHSARWLGLVPLLICFLAYSLPPGPDIGKSMRISALLLSLHGLSQLFWNPLNYAVLSAGNRICGALGSPPTLGCVLAMCLPFCYGRAPWRVLLSMLAISALVATGSRGPMLASLVAAGFMVTDFDRPGRAAIFVGIFCLGTAGVLAFNHGSSDQLRWMTWISALKVWRLHPIFGCGAESFGDAWRAFHTAEWAKLVGRAVQDHAHNDFLMVLASTGLFGFSLYCLLLRKTYIYLKRADRVTVSALIALFVCAKFNAVPFAALFAAALMLGSLEIGVSMGGRLSGVAVAAAAVCCIAFYADICFYKARRVFDYPGIERAARINPSELLYQAHESDLLTHGWEQHNNDDWLFGALQISRDALRRHPSSVQARHMLTQNLVLLAQRYPGYIAEAQESAAILVKLDPMVNFQFHVVTRR